jgi:hypothetical protein
MPAADWRRLIWPVALAAAVTLCSSITLPTWGQPKYGTDKLVHLMLFGLLANFVGRMTFVRRCRPLGVYTAVLIVSFFGVVDELHQHFTPGRSMDVLDWTADTLGAFAATLLYQHSRWYRTRLEKILGRAARLLGATVRPLPHESSADSVFSPHVAR